MLKKNKEEVEDINPCYPETEADVRTLLQLERENSRYLRRANGKLNDELNKWQGKYAEVVEKYYAIIDRHSDLIDKYITLRESK